MNSLPSEESRLPNGGSSPNWYRSGYSLITWSDYHWKNCIRLDFCYFKSIPKKPNPDFFHIKEPMAWMRKKEPVHLNREQHIHFVDIALSALWVFKAGALTDTSHCSGLPARGPVGVWCGSWAAPSAPHSLVLTQIWEAIKLCNKSWRVETTAYTDNLHVDSKPNTMI